MYVISWWYICCCHCILQRLLEVKHRHMLTACSSCRLQFLTGRRWTSRFEQFYNCIQLLVYFAVKKVLHVTSDQLTHTHTHTHTHSAIRYITRLCEMCQRIWHTNHLHLYTISHQYACLGSFTFRLLQSLFQMIRLVLWWGLELALVHWIQWHSWLSPILAVGQCVVSYSIQEV